MAGNVSVDNEVIFPKHKRRIIQIGAYMNSLPVPWSPAVTKAAEGHKREEDREYQRDGEPNWAQAVAVRGAVPLHRCDGHILRPSVWLDSGRGDLHRPRNDDLHMLWRWLFDMCPGVVCIPFNVGYSRQAAASECSCVR